MMGWGRSGKMNVLCTGSRPERSFPEIKTAFVPCINCEKQIETAIENDGLPVVVISCPYCGAVFNRETKKILVVRGQAKKE